MNEEWLPRNPHPSRKRDRRSYDDNWNTYESRAGGAFGRQPSWRGSSSSSVVGGAVGVGAGGGYAASANVGVLNGDRIMAEGERVGIPHNGGGDGRYSAHQQQKQQSSYRQSVGGGGSNANAPSAYIGGRYNDSTAQQSSHGGQAASSSRIRVADYRGAAARVGALPTRDTQPSPYQSFSRGNHQQNSINNNNNNSTFSFLNEAFIKSISSPPPITVHLPPELRSTLCTEQCTVVESILSGHSTFFSGPAGSGKSHVLNTLLKANSLGLGGKNDNPRKIVVTATTGVSACNIGGITIHSFAGVGAGTASSGEMVKRVMGNEYTKTRWREVDVLVIDEVSMMASSFLDKLDFVAQRARNDRRPFGGVQLVVCGDFFQLPPVELKKDGFAFEAKCWSEVIKCSVLLTKVFRQKGDTTLMSILDEARVGELSVKSAEVLRRHGTLPSAAFGGSGDELKEREERIIPTLLECRNKDVDMANEREMAKLQGEIHTFTSRDRAISEAHKAQLKHCQAPAQLDLKVGAQVILLKNIDLEKGLANGSRGVVVRFQPPKSDR